MFWTVEQRREERDQQRKDDRDLPESCGEERGNESPRLEKERRTEVLRDERKASGSALVYRVKKRRSTDDVEVEPVRLRTVVDGGREEFVRRAQLRSLRFVDERLAVLMQVEREGREIFVG